MNKTIESQRLEIQDLHTRLNESKLKQVLLESTKAQNEELATSQKAELTEEIDKLKLTLQHSDEKILTITTNYEEQVNSLQIDKQHLIESLNQLKQQIENIHKLWNEEKIKYQHAQYNIQMLQIQIKHLNDDLKQALLIKPNLYLYQNNQHDHLIEQLNSIINHCNQLENENIQLKQTINIMSEQAKQFAQLSIINDNDHKLCKAIKQIYRLSIEKQSLIELSNRLQSKLRQLNQYQKQPISNNSNDDGGLNNIQNSMVNHLDMIDNVKNMKKLLNNNNESITMIKDNLNNAHLDNDHDQKQQQHQYHMTDDIESIITGKGSISTIFKLLDEVHSLDSENDIESLYGNRLIIQGKHKYIHNSKV
ncbi:Unconventional myosin-Vc [Schistosoma haematobium]|nr:Unconventional myosin-Vc [Schistosoma haematobium]KAH9589641.1 Unconventional myosin-Vc [Schistosoma haematobium]